MTTATGAPVVLIDNIYDLFHCFVQTIPRGHVSKLDFKYLNSLHSLSDTGYLTLSDVHFLSRNFCLNLHFLFISPIIGPWSVL